MKNKTTLLISLILISCVPQSKYDEALKEIKTLKQDQDSIIVEATYGTNDTLVKRTGVLKSSTLFKRRRDTAQLRWIRESKKYHRELTDNETFFDDIVNPVKKPKPKTLKKKKSNWTTKSYNHLKYSYPKNWVEMEYIEAKNNISYGAMSFDLGKTVQFSVIELPNQTGITNAKDITNDQIKIVIQNLFSPNSHFQNFESKKIDNINAKYAKVSVTSSNNKKLSAINYIIFHDNNMIIIQGIYTTKNEKEYLPILKEIISKIDVI